MNPLTERRGSFRPQPKNTILYEVKTSDTLAGIAARYNTTPSELTNINRLGIQTVFPGQIIYVPEKPQFSGSESQVLQETLTESTGESSSPKPGHVERVPSVTDNGENADDMAPHLSPSQLAENLDKECLTKFLKINVKYITDGEGVVSGVLLITPNHLMFDPNVSDPLVIEHGVEKYGVIAPMSMIVRAALYSDIVRMKIKDAPLSSLSGKRVNVYHPKTLTNNKLSEETVHSDTDLLLQENVQPKETDRENAFEDNNADNSLSKKCKLNDSESLEFSVIASKVPNSVSSCELSSCSLETFGSLSTAVNKDSEESRTSTSSALELEESIEILPPLTASLSQSFESSGRKSSSEDECITFSLEEKVLKKKTNFEKTKHKIQKSLRKLSISDSLFPSSANIRRMSLPASSPSFSDLKNKGSLFPSVNKKSKTVEEKPQSESSGLSYVNMVDDKPDLFASLEKLFPRPAKSFDVTALYLCLCMGQPLKKSLMSSSTLVKDYGTKLKAEYWFSVPQPSVDELYHFFMKWAPEKYGDIDDVCLEELGFLPINEDNEETHVPSNDERSGRRKSSWAALWKRKKSKDSVDITKTEDLSPVDWEFLSLENDQQDKVESQSNLPELLSPSCILTEEHIKKLDAHLPPRAVGYPWTLIYSTALHGFSLKTMYREMAEYETPVLLVIASTTGVVFGAMLSCSLKISDHFYGTGETFLFTFYPEFKLFPWAGGNHYFIKGNAASFAVGASEGHFGLWLDDDLYHGCTKSCQTFANDCLCDHEDFVVNALEAWGFI